jgi:hypothetical protein
MKLVQNRRRFLTTLSSAGAAGLLIGPAPSLAQEAPPETTTVRLTMMPGDLHCAAIRGRGAAQERGFFRGQIRRRTIDGTIDDHMADLAGAQFLRFGGKAEPRIDLSVSEQLHGRDRWARHPVDVLCGGFTACGTCCCRRTPAGFVPRGQAAVGRELDSRDQRRLPEAPSITSASADRGSGFGHRQSSSASRVTAGAAGLSRPVTVIATPGGVAVRAVSGRLQPPGRHHRIVQTGIGL